MKVAYQTLTSNSNMDIDKNILLSANFKLSELANNAGDPKQPQYILSGNSQRFNEMLQRFREYYGKPIAPTS